MKGQIAHAEIDALNQKTDNGQMDPVHSGAGQWRPHDHKKQCHDDHHRTKAQGEQGHRLGINQSDFGHRVACRPQEQEQDRGEDQPGRTTGLHQLFSFLLLGRINFDFFSAFGPEPAGIWSNCFIYGTIAADLEAKLNGQVYH